MRIAPLKILLTTLLLLCFSSVNAEIVKITSLEAVEIAFKNNLELQAKRKDYEIQKQEIKIANALKNPQFQTNVLLGNATYGNFNQYGASLPIELFKRGPRKKAEIAKLKKVEQEINYKEHELKIKVLRSYFEVLYMKSILKVYQERDKVISAMDEVTKAKTKSASYEVDKLQSGIKRKKQELSINKIKTQLQIAQLAFNDVLNLKDDSTMYDTKENTLFDENIEILNINLPKYSIIECAALQYSYQLKIAESEIEYSKDNLKIQKSKIIPNLTLNAGYTHQAYYYGDNTKNGAYIGGGFDIPILYQYKPEIEQAKTIIEKSKINKDSYESHLKSILKQNYNQYKCAKENIEYYKTILNDSRKVLKIYSDKYKKGQVSLLNLLQVESLHKEIVNEYLMSMYNFYSAYLDLMFNVGHEILLDDDAL